MTIHLYNTLGKTKQEFKPINESEVRLYSCGPTVYYDAHIGNLRAYVFVDILKRTLKYNGYKVKHIMNVTDIGHLTSDADDGEDKMVKALKREGKEMTLENMRGVADFYFEKFKVDLEKLNIEFPDKFPFASDHIKESAGMISVLIQKGFAYQTSDGIYFDTSKDENYGKLGGISSDNDHSRIEQNTEKKDYRDFALWKFTRLSPARHASDGKSLADGSPAGGDIGGQGFSLEGNKSTETSANSKLNSLGLRSLEGNSTKPNLGATNSNPIKPEAINKTESPKPASTTIDPYREKI